MDAASAVQQSVRFSGHGFVLLTVSIYVEFVSVRFCKVQMQGSSSCSNSQSPGISGAFPYTSSRWDSALIVAILS